MALLGESWSGTASCGHTIDLDLSEVSIDRRQARVSWMETTGKCRDCFAADREKQFQASKAEWLAEKRAEEAEAIAHFEQETDLPALDGSAKQIDFARRVRWELLTTAHEALVFEGDMEDTMFTEQIEAPARLIGNAGWWLDQRGAEPQDLAALLAAGTQVPANLAACENPA